VHGHGLEHKVKFEILTAVLLKTEIQRVSRKQVIVRRNKPENVNAYNTYTTSNVTILFRKESWCEYLRDWFKHSVNIASYIASTTEKMMNGKDMEENVSGSD
jgi:FtsZ-binding cell division protein ZapB